MSEPIIFMDTEVFTNYFLVKFMSEHEGFYLSYDCGVGCRFQSPYQLKPLIEPLFRNHTVVTFNGIHFDIPILAVAMKSGSTLESVKRACDLIINHKLKPWDIEREFNVRVPKGIDHIDLIDVAPLVGSLKVYGGRMMWQARVTLGCTRGSKRGRALTGIADSSGCPASAGSCPSAC